MVRQRPRTLNSCFSLVRWSASALALGIALFAPGVSPAHASFFDIFQPQPAPAALPPSLYRAPVQSVRSSDVPRRKKTLDLERRNATERARAAKNGPADALKSFPGPHVIVISLDQQKLTLYANGIAVARSAVSTGVPGHPTPTGVFSIIQRRRFHHSNIYSGAPMPFMQRITWSGIALHAGIVPGRPASHGCIRLPAEFAQRLWGITKIGARVIIARHEPSLTEFTHPLLAELKKSGSQATAPSAEKVVKLAATDTPGIATDALAADLPSSQETGIRGSIATQPDADVKPVGEAPITVQKQPTETMAPEAAKLAPGKPESHEDSQTAAGNGPSTERAETVSAVESETKAEPLKSATPAETPPVTESETKAEPLKSATPAETTAAIESEAKAAPEKAETITGAISESKSEQAKALRPAETAPPTVAAATPVEAANPPSAAQNASLTPAVPENSAPATPVAPVPGPQPTEPTAKPALPPVRPGPVSIFVSRKEGKLFVRKGMAPVFDAPIKVDQPDRPLGTHVFTALEAASPDASLRWSVVSLPVDARKKVEPRSAPQTSTTDGPKGRKLSKPLAELATTVNPADALERIAFPDDVKERIAEWIIPGASIIISDNGLSHETGLETDFVVLTR